jgi:hypothetical protein
MVLGLYPGSMGRKPARPHVRARQSKVRFHPAASTEPMVDAASAMRHRDGTIVLHPSGDILIRLTSRVLSKAEFWILSAEAMIALSLQHTRVGHIVFNACGCKLCVPVC